MRSSNRQVRGSEEGYRTDEAEVVTGQACGKQANGSTREQEGNREKHWTRTLCDVVMRINA